jgi:hypothetical protein
MRASAITLDALARMAGSDSAPFVQSFPTAQPR